ncbi:MAG: hypothetical protein ISS69_03065 [Phycisphaerae bacterium]|nr:hypothetical protein [Planctomycetota bacterium]MBL7219068.1 hypothetical protein [Phycisphaerae bacterium]
MTRQNNSIAMFKKRLVAEMARDKKKAVILVSLLLVAVFFVGKMLLKGSPQDVSAAPNPAAMATGGPPMVPAAGNTNARTITAMNPTIKEAKGFTRRKKITRDIFMPDPSLFPRIKKKTADVKGNVNVVETGQNKREAELERKKELIRKQGAELHLESMITGRVPIAIINGTVLGLDGAINGFRVVKIGSQVCVLEKEGFTVTLTME